MPSVRGVPRWTPPLSPRSPPPSRLVLALDSALAALARAPRLSDLGKRLSVCLGAVPRSRNRRVQPCRNCRSTSGPCAAIFGYAFLYHQPASSSQHQTWPDVPGTLPAIIGVSARYGHRGADRHVGQRHERKSGEEAPTIADLVTSRTVVVAVDRVQMLCWTILGVGTFVSAVLHEGPGQSPACRRFPRSSCI